ncbi:helix-turn-helix domain-containing protein [Nocardioides caeni]|jgi:DNA-binding Xre family transcriptional regulator|uniref:Helix-turn-helix transcriptional regulator n=2 Tax=Nocardioides TaxID=1839 RepID=A0A4S8NLU3_9ACTN|nr:helix-turn-helix transcriptional regulator [Nocardioides caeni]MCA9239611.1 helix-turn-helix transcriptional regulator [Planctomycetales bacterium]MCA9547751.1 helix-turn-helix transcriptional regulator [Myxococcales bacterium]HET6920984.1 helix-turn-helix transcriptional regulator [Jiangellaceae bacterium]HEX5578625.1 helix-turn-helix transcriptional regulator [Candidatus Limnocylindria bacterium]THV15994.1 helix-turn-helix transcriptional regulator [Nocardioides caeni]
MQWSLRLRAAERGIWKSAELRRMLADAGLEISAGKMSSWWAGTPPTMRLEELDVLCAVLECTPNDLMTPEPDKVAARRARDAEAANGGNGNGDDNPNGGGNGPVVSPRFGQPRSTPPL